MKPKEYEVCHQIIQELLKWPIAQMFYHYNDTLITDNQVKSHSQSSNPQPLSFEIIINNLKRGVYSSPASVILHLRSLFTYAIYFSGPGSIRTAAARQLSMEFENILTYLSPSLSIQTLELQKIEYDLYQFLKYNPINIPKKENPHEMPASEFFKTDFSNDTPEQISKNIQIIQSPNIILRILSFIYVLQPEIISFGDDDISIKFGLMSTATLEALRDFIPKVALEAANGTIDPFFRSPCSHVKSTSSFFTHAH